MLRYSLILYILSCFLTKSVCFSQIEPAVKISGKVVDAEGKNALYHIMVINQQSGTGMFAQPDGTFSIQIQRTDTMLFNASGYSIKKVCFKDSVYKTEYNNLIIRIKKIEYNLKEVNVIAIRKLDEIQKDIKKLGVKNTDTYKNVGAQSPITFLYERFSRIEQSKRKVAELENWDRRRDVLKDLFHLYIKYDIINLSDDQFDAFISYCNLSDEFIKDSTQYDLVMTIKNKYKNFEESYKK